jgi:hypothetical protein
MAEAVERTLTVLGDKKIAVFRVPYIGRMSGRYAFPNWKEQSELSICNQTGVRYRHALPVDRCSHSSFWGVDFGLSDKKLSRRKSEEKILAS